MFSSSSDEAPCQRLYLSADESLQITTCNFDFLEVNHPILTVWHVRKTKFNANKPVPFREKIEDIYTADT